MVEDVKCTIIAVEGLYGLGQGYFIDCLKKALQRKEFDVYVQEFPSNDTKAGILAQQMYEELNQTYQPDIYKMMAYGLLYSADMTESMTKLSVFFNKPNTVLIIKNYYESVCAYLYSHGIMEDYLESAISYLPLSRYTYSLITDIKDYEQCIRENKLMEYTDLGLETQRWYDVQCEFLEYAANDKDIGGNTNHFIIPSMPCADDDEYYVNLKQRAEISVQNLFTFNDMV